jgi:MFS superfamily sulfate permease-like transporter
MGLIMEGMATNIYGKIAPNIKSGFFIALIAMPLCLGIAIASSFPPVAGILTAIVGGLVVSLVGGSELSIKGPAAGLIVIVLGSVTELGAGDPVAGYKRTLAVGAVAALLQIIFALLRTARFGRLMPPSVIHGMLAAIGVIIVSKQVHILFGAKPAGKTTFDLIAEIPNSVMHLNPELAFIGLLTLCMIVILPFIPAKILKSVPPALFALGVVIPIGIMWKLGQAHDYQFMGTDFHVGPEFLVNIPANILSSITLPDFSVLATPIAYKYIIMLALVGSIESVLTVIAVDSLGEQKEKSNLDRDLLGVGIGNLICSMIGALPMISEVVRSKANIDSGATSRLSNFFHGAFLLLAISLFAPFIKEIPLAALAAMLILTGMRLAAPKQFLHSYKVGPDQLVLFLFTLFTTLASDLLMGVIAGLVLKVLMHLRRGAKLGDIFKSNTEINHKEETFVISVRGPAIFSNYRSLEKRINEALAKNDRVAIDFSEASLVDHTTLSCLHTLQKDIGSDKIAIIGLENLKALSEHQLATHRYA